MIFNYTQPAEDAVDEALTGLKSALAVKIYGHDLQVLEDKAVEIKRVLSQVPGFTELTVVRELGQPSVQIDVDREKIARYGINVSDVEGVIQAGVGGQAATQVIQGERLFDLVVRMKPRIPLQHARDRQFARADAFRAAGADFRAGHASVRETARRLFIAKIIRGTSACSSASRGATWRAQWTRRRKRCASRWRCRKATRSIGAASTANTSRRAQQFAVIGPLAIAPDFHDPVRAIRQPQIPGDRDDRRGDDRAGGRPDGPETHAHAI